MSRLILKTEKLSLAPQPSRFAGWFCCRVWNRASNRLNTGSTQQALEDPTSLSTHGSVAQGCLVLGSCVSEQMTRISNQVLCLHRLIFPSQSTEGWDSLWGWYSNCVSAAFVIRAQFWSFIPHALMCSQGRGKLSPHSTWETCLREILVW